MGRKIGQGLLLTAAWALVLLAASQARAASTEPMVDNADMSARIAHIKAKAKTQGKDKPGYADRIGTAQQLNELNTCGSVDIGNIFAPNQGRQPREVTVIITGDVINSPDCK